MTSGFTKSNQIYVRENIVDDTEMWKKISPKLTHFTRIIFKFLLKCETLYNLFINNKINIIYIEKSIYDVYYYYKKNQVILWINFYNKDVF